MCRRYGILLLRSPPPSSRVLGCSLLPVYDVGGSFCFNYAYLLLLKELVELVQLKILILELRWLWSLA